MNDLPYIILALFLFVNFWFLISLLKKRNDVADVAWGLGFILVALLSLLLSPEGNWRNILVCVLVIIWGIRLALHISARHRGSAEDSRYQVWRNTWEWFYVRSYFQVYLLQGMLLLVIALPIIYLNLSPGVSDLRISDIIGLLIWTL